MRDIVMICERRSYYNEISIHGRYYDGVSVVRKVQSDAIIYTAIYDVPFVSVPFENVATITPNAPLFVPFCRLNFAFLQHPLNARR